MSGKRRVRTHYIPFLAVAPIVPAIVILLIPFILSNPSFQVPAPKILQFPFKNTLSAPKIGFVSRCTAYAQKMCARRNFGRNSCGAACENSPLRQLWDLTPEIFQAPEERKKSSPIWQLMPDFQNRRLPTALSPHPGLNNIVRTVSHGYHRGLLSPAAPQLNSTSRLRHSMLGVRHVRGSRFPKRA